MIYAGFRRAWLQTLYWVCICMHVFFLGLVNYFGRQRVHFKSCIMLTNISLGKANHIATSIISEAWQGGAASMYSASRGRNCKRSQIQGKV